MERFERYFRMNTYEAIEYVKVKRNWNRDALVTGEEIGDGNINYVYRVVNSCTKESVIVKQADERLRSSGRKLSTDRSRIEAELSIIYNSIIPGCMPQLYLYDPTMCCIIMQDLNGYKSLRSILLEHKVVPSFSDSITTFMAEVLMRTTDNILDPVDKKNLLKIFVNPELCQISEKLIFTDPYTNHYGSNLLLHENEFFLKSELYEDMELLFEVAKLKERYKTVAQALIHGDLHTGSIFCKDSSVMILDGEFAFYGPVGFDIGVLIANLILAWINAIVTMEKSETIFIKWLEDTIIDIVDLFSRKAYKILKENSTEPLAKADKFIEWYLDEILADIAGMTGLEINRRIIGDTKVIDITGIQDMNQRIIAERIGVRCAKNFILRRNEQFRSGKDYINIMHEAVHQINSFEEK